MAGHERYALVLFKRFVPITLNFRVMREEVLTAKLRRDKAVALVVVKPLHNTSFNLQCKSLIYREKNPHPHYEPWAAVKI
ncbi:hypothetical protein D3C86_1757230 [compost metagenome]